ncbi:MFS transporter [Arthrobacter sp. Sa2BUA2]|uniref:MFS transporter n=1 Tax=Arthrobacter pullicola TaxID=2762224 RepID=A0ABR8YI21_9MICC|nr:MFS transporter [Arthrobacter pullicola]MBD8043778.1 MFS transporter [Arthrobacter pullicola]
MPQDTLQDEQVSGQGPRQPGAPFWLITAILGCGGIVVSLEKTAVVPLLPEYPRIFGVSSDDVSWLVTVTLLSAAVATPVVSRLADMFGKKRMLLVALTMMVAGGFTAAVGGTFTAALVGRTLQGFAGAVIPIGISILRDTLPQRRVAGAVSLMSASFGIGSALGLPMAGFIYQNLGWQATFWVVALIALILTAAVYFYVPESTVRTKGRFDYFGAVLLSGAMTALLLAISKGGLWGWTSDIVLGLFAACAVLLAAWFPHELRSGQPLIDLRTSARRPVLLVNIASVLVGFSMYANMLVTTQQLQLSRVTGFGFGLSVLVAGLAMIPAGLAMVAISPVSARLTNSFGAKVTMVAGCTVMAAGYLLRVVLVETISGIIVGAVIISVGTAMAMAAMPTIVMSNSPRTDTAAANGLNTLLRSVGTSTCSAAVAVILASITVDIGGRVFPDLEAFRLIFILAGLTAAAGAAVSVLIPKSRHREATHPDLHSAAQGTGPAPAGKHEILLSGVLRPAGGRAPLDQGTVTVTDSGGSPVDWDRSDEHGTYAVVLPGPGRYIFIAGHARWRPVAEVLEFPGTAVPHDIQFHERLLLEGRIRHGSRPVQNALVLLVRGAGDPPAAVRSGRDGSFELPLPGAGRYVLTVVEPSGQTHTRRVVLPCADRVVDVELGSPLKRTGLQI